MKRPAHTRRRTLALATGLAFGLVSGVIVTGSAIAGQSDRPPPGSGQFGTNPSGQTYGSAMEAISPDKEPDLIQADATNGKQGYVKKFELEGSQPKTPDEASAMSVNSKERTIKVYTSDGKTVIGEFVIADGTGEGAEPVDAPR